MHVFNYNATFSPIYLVFLELDADRSHLNFRIFDENNNELIPRNSISSYEIKNEYMRQ